MVSVDVVRGRARAGPVSRWVLRPVVPCVSVRGIGSSEGLGTMSYYIARGPDVPASAILQAHAAPHADLVTAVQDMGVGVVFDARGEIVAFHERHAEWLSRRGVSRMTNAGGE